MPSDWNLLAETLARTRLSPKEAQVLAAVARKTLGYRKPHGDRISASQITGLTGIGRTHVTEALIRLEQRGLIDREQGSAGRAAWIRLTLHKPTGKPVPAPGHPNLSGRRDTHLSDTGGQEPVPPPGHTKVEGVNQREEPDPVRRAFDAYIGAGGSVLLERERGALARNTKAALTRGATLDQILAAARSLGRNREFPGFLQQRIVEIRDAGGPCDWDSLDRSALTTSQLRECGCARCAEWANALQQAASTAAPA
jgi:phage replication O-like protein O